MRILVIFHIAAFSLISCDCGNINHVEPEIRFQLKWKDEYERTVFTSSMIGGVADQTAYIVITDKIYAIKLSDGQLMDIIDPDVNTKLVGSRNVIIDGTNMFINHVDWIRKYNLVNNELVWSIPQNQNEAMLLTEMSDDREQLYVPKLGGAFVVRKTEGTIVDTFDLKEILQLESDLVDIRVRELIKTAQGKFLFAVESYDPNHPAGFITSIDIDSKEVGWTYFSEPDTASMMHSPPITKMGVYSDVLIALRGNHVSAFDIDTGELLWDRYFPDLGFFFGLRVSNDGTLYIGSTAYERVIIALNSETGTELWRNNLNKGSVQYLQIKDDLLFVLAEHLVILDRHNGDKIFDFVGDTGDFFYVPPTIGDDCFIGISSERVYCWSY